MAAEVNDRSNMSKSSVEELAAHGSSPRRAYSTPVVKRLGNVRTLTLGGSVDFIGDGNKKPGG